MPAPFHPLIQSGQEATVSLAAFGALPSYGILHHWYWYAASVTFSAVVDQWFSDNTFNGYPKGVYVRWVYGAASCVTGVAAGANTAAMRSNLLTPYTHSDDAGIPATVGSVGWTGHQMTIVIGAYWEDTVNNPGHVFGADITFGHFTYVFPSDYVSTGAQGTNVLYSAATPPTIPAGIDPIPCDQTFARITWTESGGTGIDSTYAITRNGIIIATGVSGGSYTDTPITLGTTYTYTVTGEQTGAISSPVVASPMACSVVPPVGDGSNKTTRRCLINTGTGRRVIAGNASACVRREII